MAISYHRAVRRIFLRRFRRDLWVPGTQRGREDHYDEDRPRSCASDDRVCRASWDSLDERPGTQTNWVLAGVAVFLRLPDRRRIPDVLRWSCRPPKSECRSAHYGTIGESRAQRGQSTSAPEVLERHAAENRIGAVPDS